MYRAALLQLSVPFEL